jgi:hypothetical protein
MLIAWIAMAGDLRADDIVLKSGELIEGSIVDATRNTVIVRRAIGGMRQMPIEDIEEVRIDLVQGAPIAGQILSWVDGVYQIRSGGEVVRIRAGRILTRERAQEVSRQAPRALTARIEESAVAAAAPDGPAAEDATAESATAEEAAVEETVAAEDPAEESAAERAAAETTTGESGGAAKTSAEDTAARQTGAESAAAEAAAGEDTAAEDTAAEDTTAETAAAESPVDESRAAAVLAVPNAGSDRQPVAVKASVDPAVAGAAGMVFKIELSRPAEQTVVLIYGTVDGTAKAGQDYEAQQGVVTLAPGARSTEVHVPLIEHQPPRGGTRFELFLAADPKVAEVVDQRVAATIPSGD